MIKTFKDVTKELRLSTPSPPNPGYSRAEITHNYSRVSAAKTRENTRKTVFSAQFPPPFRPVSAQASISAYCSPPKGHQQSYASRVFFASIPMETRGSTAERDATVPTAQGRFNSNKTSWYSEPLRSTLYTTKITTQSEIIHFLRTALSQHTTRHRPLQLAATLSRPIWHPKKLYWYFQEAINSIPKMTPISGGKIASPCSPSFLPTLPSPPRDRD